MNKKLVLLVAIVALFALTASAQPVPYQPLSGSNVVGVRWGLLSAAIVLGLAAFAGALGQARAIAAACEGIARNPSAAPAIRHPHTKRAHRQHWRAHRRLAARAADRD